MLRPPPAVIAGVLDTGCFPLLPYANRIANGKFWFADEIINLPCNFGDHPHSLHGVGWQSAWHEKLRSSERLILINVHEGGPAWPWRYESVQNIALDHSGLTNTLSLRNLDIRQMPGGLGFHPYFAAHAGDRLRFQCAETWLTDDTQLVTHAAPVDAVANWEIGGDVFRDELVDHCHGGWRGVAEIIGEDRTIRVSATGTPFLHVHIPPGLDQIGIEPVTHMPNAVNRAEPAKRTGLRILAPGEAMTITMRITLACPPCMVEKPRSALV